MERDDVIYHPHKTFESQLKRQYHDTAVEFFDELVEKTSTDAAANKTHVASYRAAKEELDAAKKKLNSTKGKRTLFIVLLIVGLVAALIGFVAFGLNTSNIAPLIVALVGLVVGGLSIWGIVVFNKKSKSQESALAPLEEKVKQAMALCQADMAALNAEFDWNMAAVIMEKATPMIDLDPYFSNATLEYLINHFGFPSSENEDTSVLGLVSGRIQGNPFVLEKVLAKTMGRKTYTGSITITWVEYVGSGKDRHAVTRSQVLTASVTKDCPFYDTETRLIFGSEAAPNLCFSRSPFGADKMDEKAREKAWKSGGKKLDKMVIEATKKGQVYSKMNNDEFEVFWGGNDRNNEVEFRFLFTPLAQQSILELIENPKPYGDDFYFVKDKMLNSVASAHSQNFDYCPAPSYFYDYCLEDCKARFVSYSDEFVQGLYFDLAPFLAIPAYQAIKTRDYIYGGTLDGNYNCYEHEVFANGFDSSTFRPKEASSDVPIILKAGRPMKRGSTDVVPIHAYSYKKVQRVEYITRFGGDGRSHSVPVYWDEYIPMESEGEMALKNLNTSQKGYRSALSTLEGYLSKSGVLRYFERGFLALAGKNGSHPYEESLDGKLESMFAPKE